MEIIGMIIPALILIKTELVMVHIILLVLLEVKIAIFISRNVKKS